MSAPKYPGGKEGRNQDPLKQLHRPKPEYTANCVSTQGGEQRPVDPWSLGSSTGGQRLNFSLLPTSPGTSANWYL